MRNLLVILFLFISVSLKAQLRFPSIISSGMVLQQNDSVLLWGWAGPGEKIYVTTGWNDKRDSTRATNYAAWKIKVKTPEAGGPYTITFQRSGMTTTLTDVMIGEVWVCSGQSNMEMNFQQYYRKEIKTELPSGVNLSIRFFQIPKTASDAKQLDVHAGWKVCDSISLKSFCAAGYFFGKKLQENLNVPIGLINTSWGGSPAEVWTPKEVIDGDPVLRAGAAKLKEAIWSPAAPGCVFNTMISPITNYSIAGVIWYQGESNTGTNETYQQLFTTMINSWRKAWRKNFPFYYVQIAPYAYGNNNIGALLQEAQTKSLTCPKTGMVVITDLVDNVNDIHPKNKRDIGIRLANLALEDTYGKHVGPSHSPQFKKMEIKKNKIILSFDYVPTGFEVRGKTASGFFISGATEKWIQADAKIEGDKIIVSSKEIAAPKEVRFGFGNTIMGNVFSKEGLPLCPFRTDSWTVDQGPTGK